jgi:PKD repeat protein
MSWDFGDGQTSDERAPEHFYSQPGTYTVTLTAGNQDASSSTSRTVRVVPRIANCSSWADASTDSGAFLRKIAWNGETYVAVGWSSWSYSSPVILTSRDAHTWESVADLEGGNLYDVVWANGLFIAVGKGGTLLTSLDGHYWLPMTVPTTSLLCGIAVSDEQMVAVASDGTVIVSNDGESWSNVIPAPFQQIRSVAWGNGVFVMVEDSGMAISRTGHEWLRTSGWDDLKSIHFAGGRFVALGDGAVMTSSDGLEWYRYEVLMSRANDLSGLAWTGVEYVIVGDRDLYISSDLKEWQARESPSDMNLNAALWAGSHLVVVGKEGTIMVQSCTGTSSIIEEAYLYFVPAAAHTPGVAETYWISDLVLHNLGRRAATALVYLLRSGEEGVGTTPVTIGAPAGQSLLIADCVSSLFDEYEATGGLLVISDLPLLVSSRTYNDTSDGSYGQYIPGHPVGSAVAAVSTAVLAHLTGNDRFRSNLGLVNPTAEHEWISVELYTADGSSLGRLNRLLAPFSQVQINDVLAKVSDSSVDDAYAVCSTNREGGKLFVFSSVVDHITGDPVFIEPVVAGNEVYLPVAAHVPGANSTLWQTDIEVIDLDSGTGEVIFELLEEGTDSSDPQTVTLALADLKAIRISDALETLFNYQGNGGLRISTPEGEIGCNSRTYNTVGQGRVVQGREQGRGAGGAANTVEGGTFGQMIPGMVPEQAAVSDEEVFLVQLSSSPNRQLGYRTNIGATSMVAIPIRITVELFSADGRSLGELSFNLPPFSHRQKNDVFRLVDAEVTSFGYASVRCDTPGARYFAYASVVDNLTGDSIYLPGLTSSAAEKAYTHNLIQVRSLLTVGN